MIKKVISFALIAIFPIIFLSSCTQMLEHPSYTDDITHFSISSNNKLIFIGKEYYYELNTTKEFNEVLITVQKETPMTVLLYPFNLSLDKSINAEIYFEYLLNDLSKENIELLKSIGFYSYPKTILIDEHIHFNGDFQGKRYENIKLQKKYKLSKNKSAIVYKEITDQRKFVNKILKPFTIIADILVLIVALVMYAFQID